MLNWEKALSDLEEKKRASVQLGFDVSAELDKALLSLSGAALIFSMTFVDKFAPQKLLLPVLMSAWFFFGLSLVSVVAALRSSQHSLSSQVTELANLQKKIASPEGRAAAEKLAAREGGTAPIIEAGSLTFKGASRWNLAAFSSFVMGSLLLGIFVGYNLWNEPKDQKNALACLARYAAHSGNETGNE